MSTNVVKYAFIAGEISPTLFGRSDLTKYDLGMAEAHNFWVDYRGGLSSRPGFEFCDFVKNDDEPTRLVPFTFSPDVENTYVLLFGDGYIRFLQDGAYVLGTAKTITSATATTITSAAHGFTNGEWVKIGGRDYEVVSVTTNTYQLLSVPDGMPVVTTGFTGTATPIYEVASPYSGADLAGLSFDQYRDYIRITSRDFPPYDLVRSGHTSWAISQTAIAPYHEGPTPNASSSSAPPSGSTANANVIFAVTSVYADGTESAIGTPYKLTNVVNYPVVAGSVSISWAADPNAVEYKVYRSVVAVSESLSYGAELGYAGRTRGTKFTDPNIIPDFGQTPPNNYDPFAPGAITNLTVTAGGTGYDQNTTVSLTGGGSGFDAQVVTDDTGAIVNVVIKNGGTGYVSPTVSFSGGSGATATATARATSGTYPALSAIYQQRQIYASSEIAPTTIWGSQYNRFNNFNSSDFVLDSDSFEFNLDTAAIAPIRHLMSTRGGLLVMTQDNIWLLNGGGTNDPLTPTNALADPHTYNGVSGLRPLAIDAEILYVEGKGYAVRMLAYNEISRVYSGDDRSILSNHLFGPGRTIVRWAYQESPFKTVWSVREDGALLAFTVVKSEEVFAWTPCSTKGRFLDVLAVHEVAEDRVYVTTQRFVDGRLTKFIERMDLRQFYNVEDAWCVDAGLALRGTAQAGSVTIYKDGDDYFAEATNAVFASSVGKIIRAGNGIFRITVVVSTYVVQIETLSDTDNWIPEFDPQRTFPMSDWTLDAPVSTLTGLWHLEGETVSILGDGNVFPQQVVTNGAVTLPEPVTRAIVGLPFTCKAKTLPMIVPDAAIESRRKRIVGLGVRLTRSRGLRFGDSYGTTYAMKERTDEPWGRPTRMQEGIRYQHIGTVWDENGQTYFRLDDPLPVTLLSLVSDIEVGDEPD